MTAFPELDAARREQTAEPIGFRVRGQEFRCVPRIGVGVVVALMGPEDGDDSGVLAMLDFVRHVLVAEDWPRFEALTVAKVDPIDFDELLGICSHLCDVYAGRPTERPANSPGGPRSTGPSSTAASSSLVAAPA
ncbi:MAG: hypothetical protein KY447_09415 [Actinobacteria bacterium]|nr:hypothetical protein [Actinomycetota bacterium]